MEPNQKVNVINYINSTLSNLPKYNFVLFIEDSIQMKNIFNSVNKNQANLIVYLNKLRSILRDNPKLFCPLFENLFEKFLLIFKTENQNLIPNESFFLIFDLMKTEKENPDLLKHFYERKWEPEIIKNLMTLYSVLMANTNKNEEEELKFSYVEFLFEIFNDMNNKNINLFIKYFSHIDKNLLKISSLLFCKFLPRNIDEKEIIKIINWKEVFEACSNIINSKGDFDVDNECKESCTNIYKQIYKLYQGKNKLINNILYEGNLTSVNDFQNSTGYDVTNVKNEIIYRNSIV